MLANFRKTGAQLLLPFKVWRKILQTAFFPNSGFSNSGFSKQRSHKTPFRKSFDEVS
jgi:hypothetical protein